MSVYVDNMQRRAVIGRIRSLYSNLTADSRNELLDFADMLGLRPSTAQHWDDPLFHFPVMESQRRRAICLGAIPVTTMELLARRLGRIA